MSVSLFLLSSCPCPCHDFWKSSCPCTCPCHDFFKVRVRVHVRVTIFEKVRVHVRVHVRDTGVHVRVTISSGIHPPSFILIGSAISEKYDEKKSDLKFIFRMKFDFLDKKFEAGNFYSVQSIKVRGIIGQCANALTSNRSDYMSSY